MRLVEDIYGTVGETLEKGGTVRDFRLALKQVPSKAGWTGSDPWHANIVFRQNAATAFSAGHFGTMAEAGITHWRFKAYRDSCPICEPVLDKVFAMNDRKYYPPLHFNCDCYADPILEDAEFGEAKQRGQVASSGTVSNEAYAKSQLQPSAFSYDPAVFAKL